jgi:hypothetical protein
MSYAYERGKHDAKRERPPIFRKVRSFFVAEGDDDLSNNWTQDDRAEYMLGYEHGGAS